VRSTEQPVNIFLARKIFKPDLETARLLADSKVCQNTCISDRQIPAKNKQ